MASSDIDEHCLRRDKLALITPTLVSCRNDRLISTK